MKSKYILLFTLFALLFCVCAHANQEKKNVLYLNSYHNGYSWSDNILSGIQEVMEKSGYIVDLRIEYMDTKNRYDPRIEEMLHDYYKYKFNDRKFDAVIVSDDNAFDFILRYRDELCPGVPVVFCGINAFKSEQIEGQEKITGIIEDIEIKDNLELALRLHPDKKRMVVIGDDSVTGKAIIGRIKGIMPIFEGRLSAEYWTGFELPQLKRAASEVGEDTLLFFSPFYRRFHQQRYAVEEIISHLFETTDTPIYSSWAFLLGHGILGGELTSGLTHGKTAGEMAVRIIGGTDPSEIPIVSNLQNPYRFDHRVLEKFGIDRSKLPEGSTVINEPYRFYKLNRSLVWGIVFGMLFLMIMLFFLVVNIMSRRSFEERLKDQLSFLRILMDTIPIPIYFKDTEGRYKGCNTAFEEWFRVKREELTDQDDSFLLPGNPPFLSDDTDRMLLARRGVKIYESKLMHHDGRPRHVVLNKATQLNARNEIIGVVGGIYDIHEIQQARKKLEKTEERYRRIFENAGRGIVLLDLSGGIISVNPAFSKLTGFASTALFMEKVTNIREILVSPEKAKKLQRGLSGGSGVADLELAYLRQDGEVRWGMISARPVHDEQGAFLYIEAIAEDITDRKYLEESKRETLHKLQAVLDNIPQLVFWQDRDLKFMGFNDSFKRFLEGDEEGEEGWYSPLYGPSLAEQMKKMDRDVIRGNTPRFRIKLKIERQKGTFVWLEINKIPLTDHRKNVVGLLSTAEDITRKITLEKELLQSQKMEAMGILSGGIAHDFNNILTSIINSTELALEDIEEGSLTKSDMERVLTASRRGSQLVKQILSFSRSTQEELKVVNIAELLHEALELIRASLPGNIELSERIESGPLLCVCDPSQIHQVIMNLCTNAFQALGEKRGSLAVSLDRVKITQAPGAPGSMVPGDYALLVISDTGPGIPAHIIDRIFDPFFTTKEKGIGTGLGLSVVHGIINGHKGAVNVTSTPDESTTFSIHLPLRKDAAERDKESLDPLQTGSEKILFVEDDEEQRQVIPRVLSNLGYRVKVADNGPMALEIFSQKSNGFDLVITDFDMPGMNGFELAGHMEMLSPDTPVLIVSGRGSAMKLKRTKNIRNIVLKPYNRNAIADEIRNILE